MHVLSKVLVKVFITFALRLSCLRTINKLSLGELIHLKCIYFFKLFAQWFCRNLIIYGQKLTGLMLFLAKTILWIFCAGNEGNKIGEKYMQRFWVKEAPWARGRSREADEAPGGTHGTAWYQGHAMGPTFGLGRRLDSVFSSSSLYTPKMDHTRPPTLFTKQSSAATTIFNWGIRSALIPTLDRKSVV